MDERHGVTYRYRQGRNRKVAWSCECGLTGMDKTEPQSYRSVAEHMTQVTKRIREGRPVGLAGVVPCATSAREALGGR